MTILDNITNETAELWADLQAGRGHPAPCVCPSCFYVHQTKRQGRPYSRLLFFARWIIFKAKVAYLVEHRQAKKSMFEGEKGWQYSPGAYDKAPYRKRANEILEGLLGNRISGAEHDAIEALFDYLHSCKARTEKISFDKAAEKFAFDRWWEWARTQTKLQANWQRNRGDLHFAKRISDFIRSTPGRKCTQRELMRHFSNRRKEDFERIYNPRTGIDKVFFFGITVGKLRKSLIYSKAPFPK